LYGLTGRNKPDSSQSFIVFLLVIMLIFPSIVTFTTNGKTSGAVSKAYGALDQSTSTFTNLIHIQDLPAKKVRVGDIEIAYKAFGKGDPILLISGGGNVMDVGHSPYCWSYRQIVQ
jgi:hypothetical protein